MPDLLQTGADWLADQMKTHAGRTVTYRRGTDTVDVTATIGRTAGKDAQQRHEIRDGAVWQRPWVFGFGPAAV